MPADLILHNARIVTCDARDTRAGALAIRGDRLVAVGTDDEVLVLARPTTRTVDLGGRFVCPGFIDCHVHLSSWALVASGYQVDLEGTPTLEAALGRIRERAGHLGPSDWLRGRGWDKNRWPGGAFPTAADLDPLTGDIPAALASHDGHSVWANSAAMRVAGIEAETPDPPAGRILRNAHGAPAGVFQEAAMALVWEHVPPAGLEATRRALRAALPRAAALGLTGVHNCEVGNALRAVQDLRDSGELSLRVTRYLAAPALECAERLGLCSGFGDEWVRIGGIKAFLDGALGAQTAAMLEPFEGSSNRGLLTMEPDDLAQLIRRATRAHLAVALHAIGDRAVRTAVDAFERVRAETPEPWPRHRLEHAQHFHPADIARCSRAGLIASVQPAHMLADIDTCERQVGARSRWAFPLSSLLQAGTRLAFGSDAPVETMDPLLGLRSAVARQRRDGTPPAGWYPTERLTVARALRAYTIDAAYAGGDDRLRGSLEPGKLADLVVLSHDLLALPVAELAQVRVVATMVGGRPVYDPEGVFPCAAHAGS